MSRLDEAHAPSGFEGIALPNFEGCNEYHQMLLYFMHNIRIDPDKTREIITAVANDHGWHVTFPTPIVIGADNVVFSPK